MQRTFEVVPFLTMRKRQGHERCHALNVGDALFALRDKRSQQYFIWSYVDRQFAERLAEKLATQEDIAEVNLVHLIEDTVSSDRVDFETDNSIDGYHKQFTNSGK